MSNANVETGVSPVGRLIYGDIFQPTLKGYKGEPLKAPQWNATVAIPKTSPGLQAMFAQMQKVAQAGFPGGEPQRADFSWKFRDGDAPENQGKEGYAGCWVFKFRSGFAPNAIVDANNQQILDPNQIRRGYQVRVAYSLAANGDPSKPGVYLNMTMLQLIAQDKEIVSGPSADQVFNAPAQALPPQPGAFAALPGAQAPQGFPGAQAPQGFPGAQAPQGFPGAQAPQGFLGAQAPQDFLGAQAPQGFLGAQAPQGYTPDPSFLQGPQGTQQGPPTGGAPLPPGFTR
jgi:hypothetical protein